MKKFKAQNLRTLIILLFVAVIAVGYFTKVGIGNLSAVGFDAIAAICPLGFLETLVADRFLVPRALISFLLLIVVIIVLGRIFCAWICPVPLIQRWFPGRKAKVKELKDQIDTVVNEADRISDSDRTGAAVNMSAASSADMPTATAHTIADATPGDASCAPSACASCGDDSKTLCGHAKPNNFKLDSRHAILGGALVSTAIFGFPVFCLVCPIGLTFATILLVMRLFAFGETTWTLFLFPVILILELIIFRKWCGKICPLGALVSLVSGLNKTFKVKIDNKKCLVTTKGIECTVCHKACTRENIDPRRPETSPGALNNCTKCRDCADACPVGAISFPVFAKKEKESGSTPETAAGTVQK